MNQGNWERMKALEAENAELRKVLEWLDRLGGLGLDKHERIRAVLTPTDKICGGCGHPESECLPKGLCGR